MYIHTGQKFLRGGAVLGLLALLLIFPAESVQGISNGLLCCARQIIPALFPFFVVTQLILSDPTAHVLGLALRPLTRFWGIRDKSAPTALLLSWLGGFAVAARCISELYENGQLTKPQAEFLLVCAVGSSPAFILNTVGLLMLSSRQAGILLLAAQLLANLCCALICRPCFHFDTAATCAPSAKQTPVGLAQAVQSAVSSTLTVCGFVIFFRALAAVVSPLLPESQTVCFLLNALMEVTGGCQAGSAFSRNGLYACCAALSIQSFSVLMQVRALTAKPISLRPLLLARLIHLPLSLGILHLLVKLWPVPVTVYSSLAPRVLTRSRSPADAAFLLFLLCCFVLHQLHTALAAHRQ